MIFTTMPTLRPLWAEHNDHDWQHGCLCLHPDHPMRPRYCEARRRPVPHISITGDGR